MSLPRVFISATSGDLRSARAIARDALLTINCHPVEQTSFEPDYRTVADMLRGKIKDCQALIHIVGHRYGAEPDPASLPRDTPRRSYTQMEYHLARELGLRVYTFLLPETYPYDTPPSVEDAALTALQNEHRLFIKADPHLRETVANEVELRTRIIALQEKVIALEQEQATIHKEVITSRRWGLWIAAAVLLILGGIGYWQQQMKKDTGVIAESQSDLATQLAEVQKALSTIQQNTDPEKDPISKWPQERLENELAQQLKMKVEDLRTLLTAGRTSLDALVAGQALLASGKQAEAAEKFDAVIQHEQAAIQRLRQAYEGKAQIAWNAVRYKEVLDYRQKAAALVDKATDPLGWCDAQGKVTFIHLHLALYIEAEPLLREIVRLREQHQGPGHTDLATALNNLAQLLKATNRLAEAEPMMRRALKIDEASYGTDHPNVAIDLNNLAQLLQATNRLAEAETMMWRALKIDEASYGTDHPNVARDLNNLAQLLQATNRLAEAEPMFRRALKIDEASYGPNHPNVAIELNNLARLLQDTNRLVEAEPMFRRVVGIFETAYGKDHPNVAVALNNLAQLLQATNRLAEAEPMFRRGLKIDEASYGPDHPKVAIRLNNLAQLLQATNRLAEAEPMMRRALKIDEASYGPDHPNVARDLNNLARLLQDKNRLEEAEPMMRRMVEIFVSFGRKTGHEHPHFRAAVGNYRILLGEMGMGEEEIVEKLKELGVEE